MTASQARSLFHIPALDGLRAFAITCVLCTHAWTYPATTPILNRLAAAGWVGVDVFFGLSGFLITRILLTTRDRPDYYRRFYVRRIRRIAPAYYLLLGIVLLVMPLVSHSEGLLAARRDWFYYVAYLSNLRLAHVGWQVFLLDITWSLAVEEQFYLVWPWIVKQVTPKTLTRLCWGSICILPIVRVAGAHLGVGLFWLDLTTVLRLDSFAVGALVALRLAQGPITLTSRHALALLTVVSGVLVLIGTGQFGRTSDMVLGIGHTALGGMTALLLLGALHRHSWIDTLLSWRPAQAFGRVSYGLYLYHPLAGVLMASTLAACGIDVLHITASPLANGIVHVGLVSAAAFVTAALSYRWYETPWLTKGTRSALSVLSRDSTPSMARGPSPS